MDAIHIIGLLAGIAILAVMCYKGFSIFLASLVGGLVVVITNGMALTDGMTAYATGLSGFVAKYIFYFFVGTTFGAVMQDTGCAERLGSWIIDKVGAKGAIVAAMVVGLLMTTAGISGYVVTFTTFPITVVMWRGAKLPRFVLPAVSSAGATIGAGFLPYSPLMNNVIPTEYLGTTIASGPLYGICGAVLAFVLSYAYFAFVIKRAGGGNRSDEEVEADYAPVDMSEFSAGADKNLPPLRNAVIPILVAVVCLVAFTNLKLMSSMNTVLLSIAVAIALTMVLNWKHLKTPKETIKHGLAQATSTCMVTGAALAFGTIVAQSAAYSKLIELVLNINMGPYLTACVSTSLLAGVMASCPGGIQMSMQAFGNYFIASGANLGAIHKISVMAGLGLNTMPHSGSVINTLDFQKVSFKEGFFPMFVTSGIVPTICSLVMVILAMIIAPV